MKVNTTSHDDYTILQLNTIIGKSDTFHVIDHHLHDHFKNTVKRRAELHAALAENEHVKTRYMTSTNDFKVFTHQLSYSEGAYLFYGENKCLSVFFCFNVISAF